MNKSISIIIPVYNEELAIEKVLAGLKEYLSGQNIDYEIIAVNDGSTDGTKNIISRIGGVKLINHPFNMGYGASIKTGAKNAKLDWLLFFDADGQHKPECVSLLMREMDGHEMLAEMVVGSREGYKGPFIRQPGKRVLSWFANYLTGRKIPDLNSGMRLVAKEAFLRFLNILPNSFSLSTTITMAFLSEGLPVKYVPITIHKRTGKSSVKQVRHGMGTIILILRIIMLFNPLKVFLPVSLILGGTAVAMSVFTIIYDFAIWKSAVTLVVSAVIVFCFGLLADQIAAIRREMKK